MSLPTANKIKQLQFFVCYLVKLPLEVMMQAHVYSKSVHVVKEAFYNEVMECGGLN